MRGCKCFVVLVLSGFFVGLVAGSGELVLDSSRDPVATFPGNVSLEGYSLLGIGGLNDCGPAQYVTGDGSCRFDQDTFIRDDQNLSEVLEEGKSADNVRITDLADPIDAQDAATKSWVNDNDDFEANTDNQELSQSRSGDTVSVSIDNGNTISFTDQNTDRYLPDNPATDNVNMDGNSIENLATPTDPSDAATKEYVDNKAGMPSIEVVAKSTNTRYCETDDSAAVCTPDDPSLSCPDGTTEMGTYNVASHSSNPGSDPWDGSTAVEKDFLRHISVHIRACFVTCDEWNKNSCMSWGEVNGMRVVENKVPANCGYEDYFYNSGRVKIKICKY